MNTSESLIKEISDKYLLRDKIIVKIEFSFELNLSISLHILLQDKKIFLLRFKNVKAYCFYSDQTESNGYLVTHYKIFKNQNMFYFSFDPYTEDQRIEEEDNNYIYSEEIFGEIIK